MNALVLFAAAVLLAQERNAAEELLRKADKALASAVTLRFAFELNGTEYRDIPPAGGQVTGTNTGGTIEIIRGNRVRLYGSMPSCRTAYGSSWITLVSDGKTMSVEPEGKPSAVTVATPDRLNRDLVYLTLRLGAQSAIADTMNQVVLDGEDRRVKEAGGTPKPRETDPSKRVRIADLKILGREKIGARETVMIQFTVVEGAGSDQPVVTLWLNAKSHLPVQRRTTIDIPGKTSTLTERYLDIQVNEPVEP